MQLLLIITFTIVSVMYVFISIIGLLVVCSYDGLKVGYNGGKARWSMGASVSFVCLMIVFVPGSPGRRDDSSQGFTL